MPSGLPMGLQADGGQQGRVKKKPNKSHAGLWCFDYFQIKACQVARVSGGAVGYGRSCHPAGPWACRQETSDSRMLFWIHAQNQATHQQ
jgi:hypothetical protein